MVYKPEINQFFDFDRMEETLKRWAVETPELCRLHEVGESHRGRTVYALEISNFKTGNPDERPGFYIESCIHAEEVMGTNVTMYIAWYLLSNFGINGLVTQLLENQVFYILPRINPDGAEFVLKQGAPWCGNGRYLPGEEQPESGFHWKDLNGNGSVAQMRVADKDGEWKISEKDARFLVLREPWEFEGDFYRLLPEGEFRDYIGELHFPKPRDGNLNRQFPSEYYPEGRQYGAGKLPLEEPEAKAVADFIVDHPNIGGAMSYHTNAGALLRPFGHKSDKHFVGNDLAMYNSLGKMGTEITGYPMISVYHEFTPDKNEVRGGCLTDWTYDFLGLLSMDTELWNVNQASGIKKEGFYPSDKRSPEEESKVLEFLKDRVENPYLFWEPFDHPQLGLVENGGWNRIWVERNAPECMLEEIAVKHSEFSIKLAATLPKLSIKELHAEHLDDHLLRITARIGNSGYLPTYLTDQARFMKADKKTLVKLTADSEFEIIHGKKELTLEHLEGRSQRNSTWNPWVSKWEPSERVVIWTVRYKEASKFTVEAHSDKGGVSKRDIVIK
ncbi:MAG: hypothetical protein JEZ06_06640 [Anaerolineaceae bacterium]|nr:hypothetical protein [Anaerolineaceae bacterium]